MPISTPSPDAWCPVSEILPSVSTERRERPALSRPNPADARVSAEEGDPQPEGPDRL